jgi:hypothetical protein
MDDLIGTCNCPHLGFDPQGGLPCCHAGDMEREACGRALPNPAAQGGGGNVTGVAEWFCAVLGTEALPAAALKLSAQRQAQARRQRAEPHQGYQPPKALTGKLEAKPSREYLPDAEPVIPTHIIRAEKQTQPNQPCPCGSGRKYKKCCGR